MKAHRKIQFNIWAVVRCGHCHIEQPVLLKWWGGMFGFYHCRECNGANHLKCDNMKTLNSFLKVLDDGASAAERQCHLTSVPLSDKERQELEEKHYEEERPYWIEWAEDMPPDKTLKPPQK